MASPPKQATIEDSDRVEIVGGTAVEKPAASFAHSLAHGRLGGMLHPFNRGASGWWICGAVHVEYERGELYRHDLAGWHRERLIEPPREWPVRVAPDWACEIVSPNHQRADLVDKPRVLHRARVPHYWVVNPEEKLLLVHRWSPDGYVIVQRAEPFEAIELRVGELFGDDD